MRRTLSRTVIIAILAASPVSTSAAQMDDVTWKTSLAAPQGWLLRVPTGSLLVGSHDSLSAFDATTGARIWTRADLGGLTKQMVDTLPKGLLLLNVVRKDAPALRVLDLSDGREKWSVPGVSLGHWAVPSQHALMVWLWRPGDKMSAKSFGGRMTMIRLDDGKVLWEDPEFFAKWPADRDDTGNLWRVSGPVFDSDSTMITFMSGMGIRRWHIATGRNLWAAELKLMGTMSSYYGYARMLVDTGAKKVFVPTGIGLAVVSLSDGAVLLRAKLKSIPRQMEFVPGGLLLRAGSETEGRIQRTGSTGMQKLLVAAAGGEAIQRKGSAFLALLDPATGENRWPDEVKLSQDATNYVVRGDKAYVWADDQILAVALATGQSQVVAKVPGFKNDDTPRELLQTEAGLLLRGETNVMFVGYDGKLVHHSAFKRPKRSMLVRATAGVMRSGAATAASDPNDVLGALVRTGAVEVGDPDELRKRSTQTFHAGTRSTFYTEVKRGDKEDNGFVVIDGVTGQSVGDIFTPGLLTSATFSDKDVDLAFDLERGWIYRLIMKGKATELGGWRVGAAP